MRLGLIWLGSYWLVAGLLGKRKSSPQNSLRCESVGHPSVSSLSDALALAFALIMERIGEIVNPYPFNEAASAPSVSLSIPSIGVGSN